MKIKNYDEKEIKNIMRNYKSVEDFLGSYIYYSSNGNKESKEILNRLTLRLKKEFKTKESGNEIYFEVYKKYIKLSLMIQDYWKDTTKSKVDNAMILQVGRHFEDGFSGMQIKKMSYSDEYIVSIEDGEESGILFIKTYKKYPETLQLIEDSVLRYVLMNDGEVYKKSVRELFKEALEEQDYSRRDN